MSWSRTHSFHIQHCLQHDGKKNSSRIGILCSNSGNGNIGQLLAPAKVHLKSSQIHSSQSLCLGTYSRTSNMCWPAFCTIDWTSVHDLSPSMPRHHVYHLYWTASLRNGSQGTLKVNLANKMCRRYHERPRNYARKRIKTTFRVTHSLGKGNATDVQRMSFVPPMGQIQCFSCWRMADVGFVFSSYSLNDYSCRCSAVCHPTYRQIPSVKWTRDETN